MTNDSSTTELFTRLTSIRERCPEYRFGQMLSLLGRLAEDESGRPLYDVDDHELLAAMQRMEADFAPSAGAQCDAA